MQISVMMGFPGYGSTTAIIGVAQAVGECDLELAIVGCIKIEIWRAKTEYMTAVHGKGF